MKKIAIILAMSISVLAATAQQVANTFTYKTKSYTLTLLSDGQGTGNRSILIGASDAMMANYAPQGNFPTAYNAFLLQTGGHNILIDTGTGAKLLENLKGLGLNPENIDAVLLTHMHGDHIGGLLKDGKAVFPNAKIYISKIECAYWTSQANRDAAPEGRRGGFDLAVQVTQAYKDRLVRFEPSYLGYSGPARILPGIRPMAAYGHTPGHTVYLIGEGGERMLVWGDIAHAMAVQMPCPQVSVTYDVDPAQAAAVREKILDYAYSYNIPVAGMHVPYPAMGHVERSGDAAMRYVFVPMATDKSAD